MTLHPIPTDPTDPTELACDSVEIEPLHLSITQHWGSSGDESRNTHLLENGNLSVIFARGQDNRHQASYVPHDKTEGGLVVLSLGVDGDHDEVHFQVAIGADINAEELLLQAIEILSACYQSVRRIRKASVSDERNAFELGLDAPQ